MRIFLALLIVAASGTVASAAPLAGDVVLSAADVVTFDPNLFAPGPNVDVYHVVVANPNAGNATSLELSLPGAYVNLNAGPLAFRDVAALPLLGPNNVAETFFVLPAGNDGAQLAVGTIDDGSTLASSYTLPGTTSLVDAGSPGTIVAVLSVLAGSAAPDKSQFSGQAAIDGQFEEIQFIPEPSTAILALLGLAGVAARRRS